MDGPVGNSKDRAGPEGDDLSGNRRTAEQMGCGGQGHARHGDREYPAIFGAVLDMGYHSTADIVKVSLMVSLPVEYLVPSELDLLHVPSGPAQVVFLKCTVPGPEGDEFLESSAVWMDMSHGLVCGSQGNGYVILGYLMEAWSWMEQLLNRLPSMG